MKARMRHARNTPAREPASKDHFQKYGQPRLLYGKFLLGNISAVEAGQFSTGKTVGLTPGLLCTYTQNWERMVQ